MNKSPLTVPYNCRTIEKNENKVMEMHKSDRIEARLNPEQKALLAQAAALQGKSLSEFVIHSAYQTARQVVQEQELLSLTQRDRMILVQSLLDDSDPHPRLIRAANRYKESMQKG
jgi:uncharacterized protein (DUF1778 family)